MKKAPMVEAGYDVVGWNRRVDLCFSVKFAYTICPGVSVGSTEGVIVEFPFVHREENVLADVVAKLARLRDLDYAWFSNPPLSILPLMLNETLPADAADI
ncbi:hypothetical protein V6N13_004876 [Hibiscus sabdariffa]|uniref:RNase H type-1 domain-containing protein n=1 Tax=Hibiscus sabdariffa TaxID=183260 RepID=A0ABR2RZU3_9ROSI